jgi:multidrug efflux pump
LPSRSTGEYTFAIFAVTVMALVLSWVVSVYFVPYLGTLLLKVPPQGRTIGTGQADRPARGVRQRRSTPLPARW